MTPWVPRIMMIIRRVTGRERASDKGACDPMQSRFMVWYLEGRIVGGTGGGCGRPGLQAQEVTGQARHPASFCPAAASE
jgi:hypothetical protein